MFTSWWQVVAKRRMVQAAGRAVRARIGLEALETRDTPAGIVAVASSPGAAALITVFDAATHQQKYTISPFDGFTGGLNLAVGDVNGDGTADIIAAPGVGGGPIVNVYNGVDGTLLKTFTVGDTTSRAGASVAAADFDQDGLADIVV